MSHTYADAAHHYIEAGWKGVLPIPPGKKWPPPNGFTGNDGAWPSGADIEEWRTGNADYNLALRLPRGVIGIDVDAYGDKLGARTLVIAEQAWGELPVAPLSTSRPGGVSGIRLFRVPEHVRLRDRITFDGETGGIEIVQFHHRYVMAWPSIHPSGRPYHWLCSHRDIPWPNALPWLPEMWVNALTVPEPEVTASVDVSVVLGALPSGRPTASVQRAMDAAQADLRADRGSRHDHTRDNVLRLLRLAERGETGVGEALARLRENYADAVSDRIDRPGALGEFDRMVTGQRGHNLIASTPSAHNALNLTRPTAKAQFNIAEEPENSADDPDCLGLARPDATQCSKSADPESNPGGMKLWPALDLAPPARQVWLAESRIPAGAISLLTGDEGIGKSLFWVWLVAVITTGRGSTEFGIPPGPPGKVRLVITEDDWSTCACPRLIAAGADLSRITVICEARDGSGSPVFPADMDMVEADSDYTLIVVDCWLDTVSAGLRVQNPKDAREALHPWREVAIRTGAAVLLLTHTNRVNSNNPRDKYGITGELRKKARSTLFCQRDEDSGLLLIGPEKSNAAAPVLASAFRIEARAVSGAGDSPYLALVNPSDRTIREHMTDAYADDAGGLDAKSCRRWLQQYLIRSGGSAEQKTVMRDASAEGYTAAQIRHARERLGVKSRKSTASNGAWLWTM